MSVEPPGCVNCRTPLDIHWLEKEGPRIVIHKYTHITPPVGDRLNIQMFTTMKCQSCNEVCHLNLVKPQGIPSLTKRIF